MTTKKVKPAVASKKPAAKKKTVGEKSVRDHATFPPSTLAAREICPGWRNSKSTEFQKYADEGTAMHEAAEKDDVSLINDDNALLKAINSGKFARCTDEQRHCVQEVLDYVRPLERGALKALKEVRLSIMPTWWVEFGTADRLIIQRDYSIDVIDFKFGKTVVPPAYGNAQGQAYIVGAINYFRADPELRHHLKDVKKIRVHFLQPRVHQEADYWEYDIAEVDAMMLRIARISARVQEQDAHPKLAALNPTFHNCQFCGRIGECPAVTNCAIQQTNAYDAFHNPDALNLPPIESPSKIDDPRTMARARAAATILDTWSKSVKTRATSMWVDEGFDIPGYKLGYREGNSGVASPLLAYGEIHGVFKELTGVDLEPLVYMSCCDKLSLSRLDDVVKDHAPKGKKGETVTKFSDLLKERGIVTVSGGGAELRRVKSEPLPL